MSKINLLESEIYNRIAAGEVVENAKSIVKELIENSIDAGATTIEVEIISGGIDYIRVTDNGLGMEKDDLEKSILPHATSKIGNLSDLDCIATLGFRGEALASIASVSNLKIISRKSDSQLGNYISYDFGKKNDEGSCGCAEGTTVTVKNLFEKIPARKKFLRKSGAETAEVSNYITRAILSNYNVSIKYIADNETILHSDGKGLQSAIYTVYGREFMDSLIYFEHTMSDITIYGFVGTPGFCKHNRTFQTLIVNGRYVLNNDITFVMQSCYRDFLMTRQFPVWILFVDLPHAKVDVNVHPHKMDVKFADLSAVKGIIHNTVKNTVSKKISPSIIKEVTSTKTASNEFIDVNPTQSEKFYQSKEFVFDDDTDKQTDKASIYSKEDFRIVRDVLKNNVPFKESSSISRLLDNKTFVKERTESIMGEGVYTTERPREAYVESVSQTDAQASFNFNDSFEIKVLCKIFNTYILIERSSEILLIDQHAAHERLLFDKLLSQFDNEPILTQPLLLPYVFDLSHDECALLTDNFDIFASAGFSISKLSGNSYSLSTVPLACSNINCGEFISYFFEGIRKNKLKGSDVIREKIAKAACVSAVKGKDDLSLDEISELVKRLQNASELFCPHGRPIIIKITKREIEKWFKRIL